MTTDKLKIWEKPGHREDLTTFLNKTRLSLQGFLSEMKLMELPTEWLNEAINNPIDFARSVWRNQVESKEPETVGKFQKIKTDPLNGLQLPNLNTLSEYAKQLRDQLKKDRQTLSIDSLTFFNIKKYVATIDEEAINKEMDKNSRFATTEKAIADWTAMEKAANALNEMLSFYENTYAKPHLSDEFLNTQFELRTVEGVTKFFPRIASHDYRVNNTISGALSGANQANVTRPVGAIIPKVDNGSNNNQAPISRPPGIASRQINSAGRI